MGSGRRPDTTGSGRRPGTADAFDPLAAIVDRVKSKQVEAVQDPTRMMRHHISTVGRMVLHTKARDPEPFLTTNQRFSREVDVPEPHGNFVPPNPYKSWCSFDIITGITRPPIPGPNLALKAKLAAVDPSVKLSAWDHPKMLELPRAQQTTQTFSRSHSAFFRSEANPTAALEWRSNLQLLESNRRHERSALPLSDKYSRPITAASELGWGLETAYKEGRVRPNEFHFGIKGSHITKFQQSMALGPMNVSTPAPMPSYSHAGILG